MTVQQVAARVARIQRLADEGQSERAHTNEDRLYRRVLDAIANGAPDAAALARAALAARTINYARYYT